MTSEEEAQKTIAILNGSSHFGREIVVNKQQPKAKEF